MWPGMEICYSGFTINYIAIARYCLTILLPISLHIHICTYVWACVRVLQYEIMHLEDL